MHMHTQTHTPHTAGRFMHLTGNAGRVYGLSRVHPQELVECFDDIDDFSSLSSDDLTCVLSAANDLLNELTDDGNTLHTHTHTQGASCHIV